MDPGELSLKTSVFSSHWPEVERPFLPPVDGSSCVWCSAGLGLMELKWKMGFWFAALWLVFVSFSSFFLSYQSSLHYSSSFPVRMDEGWMEGFGVIVLCSRTKRFILLLMLYFTPYVFTALSLIFQHFICFIYFFGWNSLFFMHFLISFSHFYIFSVFFCLPCFVSLYYLLLLHLYLPFVSL